MKRRVAPPHDDPEIFKGVHVLKQVSHAIQSQPTTFCTHSLLPDCSANPRHAVYQTGLLDQKDSAIL